MSDIVDRLRHVGSGAVADMLTEAAAEITRLREENIRLHDDLGALRQEAAIAPVIVQHNETIKSMSRAADVLAESLDNTDEITRLREELSTWKAEAEAWRYRARYDWFSKIIPADVLVQEARAATDAIEKNAS